MRDGGHLLRLGRLSPRFLKRLFGSLPLTDVAGDLGKAEETALLVADRIDDDVGKEPAAVLADAPAFLLVAPLPCSGVEGVQRQTGFAVLGRVELREVASDDLLLGVALDPLRPGIPVGHAPVRIEHVDGVVGHPLDEQTKALLALPQRVLRLLALGQVAGDLGKADQFARLIADGVDDDVGPETGPVLAHPPALRFEAALLGCRLQSPAWHTCRPVGLRVKGGEMLTDDLVTGIALEALRARVPTDSRSPAGRACRWRNR